ncbi:hypothetical protein M8868_07520 [Pasteurella multocida]|uniref:FhaB protein n=1 Tax=Pasteurella multocida TaxID=747 RepID=UPI00035414B2|nr:FhaB protein [Pasteurella multocida]APW56199.1 hypothetical protein PMCN07_1619 [Pasteurella multocida subsp. multocida str. HN07]ARA70018.1 hypothetical protein BTV67_05585 [Pasteurella multocida subsp. multocida]ARA89904.1 hypothetical protein BTV66_10065 [Pasteurella multocida subsp. septica]AUL53998.1 hypothetical protein ATO47_07735 [Pasteurella multocida]AWB55461.1 hypothetical protein pm9n_07670 [Pasteurella multocida]
MCLIEACWFEKFVGLIQTRVKEVCGARPEKFKLENMSENRSHKNEMPGKNDIDRIIRDMRKYERGDK